MNEGDVTSPRWAGGANDTTTSPEALDAYLKFFLPFGSSALISPQVAFMAGRASRDAEVAELLAQAWAEGFKQGGPMRDEDASDPDAHTRNPYRSKK